MATALAEAGKAKRKRTRVRKRRGGRRGGGNNSNAGGLDLSSSSSDDSDDDGSSDEESAKPAVVPAAKKLDKGKARAAEPAATVANAKEDSDDDSDSSEASSSSSSSSSSFLSSSSEESTAPIPSQNLPNGHGLANGHAAALAGATDQASSSSRNKRARPPSPVREASPPYLLFGNAADNNPEAYRALGKPILHPHLPEDKALSAEDTARIAEEEEEAKAEYLRFREFYVSRMVSRYGNQLDEIRKKEGDTLSERRLGMLIQAVGNGADSFLSEKGKGIWKAQKGRGERETVLEALKRQNQDPQEDVADQGDTEMD